jgi:hypothetical protein
LIGACGCVSKIGVSIGSPYVAHVEEKTKWRTDSDAIASSTPSEPVTLLR